MYKRPLVFAIIMFFAGLFACAKDFNVYPIITFLLAVGTGALFAKRKSVMYFIAAIMIFAGFFAMDLAETRRADVQSSFSGRTEKLSLTVTGFSENSMAFVSFRSRGKTLRAYLTVEDNTLLLPGDIVTGDFSFRVPSSSPDESFSFEDYISGKGAYLTVKAEKVTLAGRKTSGLDGKIYSLRRYLNSVGKKHFSGDGRALFNAMLFGDKSLISEKLDKSLQASGLSHIAVVSGMHLSVIITFLMFFIHKIFGKSRLGLIPAFFVALAVTLATGAGASVVRAFIMSSVFLLSQIIYRENDALSSLAFAAFVMAVINPFVVFDAGFILSVLSVLGIILYNEKFRLFFSSFMPSNVAETISLSLSAQLAVMPALAYCFGVVTPYAMISNLLVVAVSSLYVIVGMAFSLVPQIAIASEILKLSSSGIISVCRAVGKLPFAIIELRTADMTFVILWVLVLFLIYMYPFNNKFVLQK